VTEQVPEGLVIRDVTCAETPGTTCEVEFDEATNLVTVSGTIDEDAVGEPVEVQFEIETGVTVDFDPSSTLEVETCVTDAAGSDTGACAEDQETAELTFELAATPSIARLPAPTTAPVQEATAEQTEEAMETAMAEATGTVEPTPTRAPSTELLIDITSAEITDQSFLGDKLTVASTILIETGGVSDDEDAEVIWSVTEQIPEGLLIRDVTCIESAGTSCEVEFDEATNVVTLTGTIDEEAVGEAVEVRLEVETGVTVDFDRSSELEIETCVTDTGSSITARLSGDACTSERASTELTVELAATPSLGRLPGTGQSAGAADSDSTGAVPVAVAGALVSSLLLAAALGVIWRGRRPSA